MYHGWISRNVLWNKMRWSVFRVADITLKTARRLITTLVGVVGNCKCNHMRNSNIVVVIIIVPGIWFVIIAAIEPIITVRAKPTGAKKQADFKLLFKGRQ